MTDVGVFRDAEHIADVSGIAFDNVDVNSSTAGSSAGIRGQDRSRVKKLQTAAKVAFIDRALRDLDILIYCQLSALYYMDCSLILLALRAIVQLIFFTPKAPPFDPTRNQPFIGAIFASNIFCMLFHGFLIRPEVGEFTRGYQHGGLFIDFIGQKPVPTFRLLVFDVLILLVDLIMLALIIERVKIVGSRSLLASLSAGNTATANADASAETAPADTQNHDAEERGVRNSDDTAAIDSSSTDHATTHSGPSDGVDDEAFDERTSLLADPGIAGNGSPQRGGHPLDLFASGQSIIMEMGIFSTIREQWQHTTMPVRRNDAGYTPPPQAATFLRERLGLQMGADGRLVRINQ
ncbi:hypothetical protein PDE_01942 [Penicillium oxalicum 114-2]|uniref:DUF1746 domain-containing protein n=1 Tax=Penicillium oxalicum (strain 114-2 / CGMCC 5302) TaxID=933388 RepID=S7ZE76_PENO1|nr:hypothetical protein PDE_01942 [Penicillium oxalicum 114-2]